MTRSKSAGRGKKHPLVQAPGSIQEEIQILRQNIRRIVEMSENGESIMEAAAFLNALSLAILRLARLLAPEAPDEVESSLQAILAEVLSDLQKEKDIHV